MRLGFWGDISFDLGVQPAEKYGYDYFFGRVKALLSSTDVNIANFDCTITNSEQKNPFRDGSHLKTKPEAARAMWEAKFKLAALANNHIWDYGAQGISDTLKAFEEYGILTSGVGRTLEEAIRPVVLDIKGVCIAIISCTTLDVKTNPSKEYIVAPLKPELIIQTMEEHRNEVAHFLISIHWGREFVNYPFAEQVQAARQLIDAGASVIVGHHSHVIGPVEKYHNGLIAYSLGDFIFGQTDRADLPGRHYSTGLKLDFDRTRVSGYEIIPIVMDDTFRPCPAEQNARNEILRCVDRLSEELANLEHLQQRAYAQAGQGFVGRQWCSLTRVYKHGGIYSILAKLSRFRLLHIKLFVSWLKQKIMRGDT